MKLKLALFSALIAISASSAHATDTRSPDILSAVSSEAVHTMSKFESQKSRGQVYRCYKSGSYAGRRCDLTHKNLGAIIRSWGWQSSEVYYPLYRIFGQTYVSR